MRTGGGPWGRGKNAECNLSSSSRLYPLYDGEEDVKVPLTRSGDTGAGQREAEITSTVACLKWNCVLTTEEISGP